MKKAVRICLLILFGFYCLMLCKVYFLDGRFQSESTVGDYFLRSNLIPFQTVWQYVRKLAEHRINLETVVRNLVGNLIVLFPMGCFLPCLSHRFQAFKVTVLCCLGMILAVELLQPLLRIGFLDIDDLIFNLFGAMLGYWTVHLPFVNRFLKRAFIYAEPAKIA